MNNKKGFTLVEMLVVVLIIAILMGLAYRNLDFGKGMSEKAVTLNRMEKLAHAIEEYRAEYGQYPPVNRNHLKKMGFDIIEYMVPDHKTIGGWGTVDHPLFQFGLLGFLMPRYECDNRYNLGDYSAITLPAHYNNWQWKDYNQSGGAALQGNGPRDARAWQRWKPYVDDIIEPKRIDDTPGGRDIMDRYCAVGVKNGARHGIDLKNRPDYLLLYFTVVDGWGGHGRFKYRSDPPHSTYRLWWQRNPNEGYDINGEPIPGYVFKASDIIEAHVGH